ncbi:MAG: NTP transferase domain-containing protein [Myxococcaceae bacterium]
MIAAAGLGSRLGLGRPKCLLEIGERSLLHHQLDLLKDVPDVRVVVGFAEQAVIDAVRPIRPDVIFVRNAAFRSTSTLASYALGAAHLLDPCLFMDADILFEPATFAAFLGACVEESPLIGVTAAKTTDAVYAHLAAGQVERFSRTERGPFEWANLCWLPARYCETGRSAVFERLAQDLPMPCLTVTSHEVDTPEDYALALKYSRAVPER